MNQKVYVTGAGPGDPGLLTLKAKKVIQKADVIIYDRLANKKILAYAKADAKLIYMGKKNCEGGTLQDQINSTLVSMAKEHEIVVRLKGGDPFVFGRGGEEVDTLIDNDLSFEVIPGITSAISVPCYAGIPVTHRSLSSQLHIFTGHLAAMDQDIDFKTVSKLKGTLLFLMSVGNLPKIVKGLTSNDKNVDTPVAIVENGTLPMQRTITGTLSNIVSKAKEQNITPPSIIVVGDVSKLRDKFSWFEQRPLSGKNICVTRFAEKAVTLAEKLEDLGANVTISSAISIERIIDKFDEEFFKTLATFDSILFSSVNSVDYFFKALLNSKKDSRVLGLIAIAVVGVKTKQRLKEYGIVADHTPKVHSLENTLELVAASKLKNLLIVGSAISDINTKELSGKYKLDITKISPYTTKMMEQDIRPFIEDLDVMTFFSTSAVNSFFESVKQCGVNLPDNIIYVTVGKKTSDALSLYGKTAVIAKQCTDEGVVEAILNG